MSGDHGFDADVIVIGSGFGGAVAALRFGEVGERVIVLERGDWVRRDAFHLMVLDGSIIPAASGPNPALTILAVAERAMERVVAQLRERVEIVAESETTLAT